MLARRLLLLAAVLLATGAIAAALTPRELRDRQPPASTAPLLPPPGAGGTPAAREVTRTVNASATEPAVVRAQVGDLLRLTVTAPSPDEVELVGLDRFQSVDEFSPARFEFFCEQTGTFPIRLQEGAREIGRLVVD